MLTFIALVAAVLLAALIFISDALKALKVLVVIALIGLTLLFAFSKSTQAGGVASLLVFISSMVALFDWLATRIEAAHAHSEEELNGRVKGG